MEKKKQEWYSKLLAKLKRIESGELSLTDYISEVEEKLRQPNVSRFVLPEERPFKNCDLDARNLLVHNQFCDCKPEECKKLDYRIAWMNAYGQHNG